MRAMILVCTWLAFSLKPPSFGVARWAQMTPSEEAKQILGENAEYQTIIKFVDFAAEARAREEKAKADAREAKADAREAKAAADKAEVHHVYLEHDRARLQDELFRVLQRA